MFNVNFDNVTKEEAINHIKEMVLEGAVNRKSKYVVTPNVDHIVNIYKNSYFKEVYDNASLIIADGMPLVTVSKYFGAPLKEKVSGSDLTPMIFKLAQEENFRVFIFGSREGVANQAIKKIKKNHQYNFDIEAFSPEFGFENNEETLAKSINKIKEFNPDILLVSLGSPKGEYFIYKNKDILNIPVMIQVGASIDFIAGTIKRAPKWMQNNNLEWFYRFIKEPKRMFYRYFINDSYFIKIIIKEFFNQKKIKRNI